MLRQRRSTKHSSSRQRLSRCWFLVLFLNRPRLVHIQLASPSRTVANNASLWSLAFMSIWIGLGPKVVLFLAGLIGVPQTLYEAAMLDGASGWQSFRRITLPMIVPTSLFVVVTSTISAIQVFTPVYMMTKGGPEDSTDVVGFHIYNEAWTSFNTGLASAKSFILFVLIACVALVQFRMSRRQLEGQG